MSLRSSTRPIRRTAADAAARAVTGVDGGAVGFAVVTLALALNLTRLAAAARGHAVAAFDFVAQVPVLGVAALAFTWRATRAPGLAPAVRRGWQLMALAHLPVLVSSVAWSAYLAAERDPLPVWLDWATVLYYPLALASLLAFPAAPRAAAGRARFLLDAATVAAAGGTLLWHFVALPASRVGLARAAESLVYPGGDLAVLAGVVALTLRTADGVLALQVLALACGVSIGADLLYANQMLRGAYAPGGWTDALWSVATWTTALAGYLQRAAATRRPAAPDGDRPRPAASPSYSLLPYAGVATVYAALLLDARARSSAPLTLVLGAGALTALAFARQAVALRENAALVAERLAREARFRSLVQHSSDVIAVLDAGGRVSFVSPSVARVFAADPEAVLGVRLLALAHPADRRRVARLLGGRGAAAQEPAVVTWRVHHPALGWRHVESVATDRLADPAVGGVVLNTRDVTERVRLEEALSRRAYHDALTGLVNRARLAERLGDALGDAAAGRAAGVAVLLVDLDGFKAVNDRLGHAAGDAVLVAAARRLEHATRNADTVARLGGDEFALVLADVEGAAEAEAAAARVVAALAAPVAVGAASATVGASVGVAVADAARVRALAAGGAGGAGPALLAEADGAMYAAKAAGKNRYAVAEPGGAAGTAPGGAAAERAGAAAVAR